MDIDKKRKEVDLKKIDANIAELEFKIIERQEDIKRIEAHIELQKTRKKELTEELNG